MSFSWVEAVVAILVAAGAYRGLKRGLVREGLALLGLVVGLVLAAHSYSSVAGLLHPLIGGGRLADVLAFLLVLLLVIGGATLLTLIVNRLLKLLFLGWIDRAGGVIFGAGQGAAVATLLLFLLVKHQLLDLDRAVKESEIAMALLGALPGVVGLLPPELASVREFFRLPRAP